jgi:hypothetical protein
MASIFMRLMNILRGKRTQSVTTDVTLDEKRAEQGLMLSDMDGDPRTTQALSDELGMRTRLDDSGSGRRAA